MTKKGKQLLLKDLCARLPYEVQCHIKHIYHLSGWIDEGDVILTGFRQDEFTKETKPLFRNPGGNPKIVFPIDSVKPYLRPMSSMTGEEFKEYSGMLDEVDKSGLMYQELITKIVDWLDKKMFDHRNLIPKGLALEAPEGMYKLL